MASKNNIQAGFNQKQIGILVEVVIEQFGRGLPEEELADAIALVLESIPGIEMESTQSIQCVIQQIRNQYYGTNINKETSR